MSREPVRIAMWSGPRNISTAMMRSFEARGDCAVSDEPFYAAYLQRTGIDHPMRAEVILSQPTDPSAISRQLLGPIPDGRSVWYQKHMTLHMLDGFERGFMSRVRNAFLIRSPEEVLNSYSRTRADVTLADIGFVQQHELFRQVSDRSGSAPPVIDAADVMANPADSLQLLCDALAITYTSSMLHWPAGRRSTDGVWAPAWYQAVEQSTGFERPRVSSVRLPPHLQKLADQARVHYDALAAHRLRVRAAQVSDP